MSGSVNRGLRITGQLTEDAQLLYTPGKRPAALLRLMVQTPIGLPYHVKHYLGDDPKTHFAAQTKLQILRRGSLVAVYCEGLRAQSDHGTACLALVNVTDVHPLGYAVKPVTEPEKA